MRREAGAPCRGGPKIGGSERRAGVRWEVLDLANRDQAVDSLLQRARLHLLFRLVEVELGVQPILGRGLTPDDAPRIDRRTSTT